MPSASRNVSREGQPTKKEKQKENVAQNNKDAGKEKKDMVNHGRLLLSTNWGGRNAVCVIVKN